MRTALIISAARVSDVAVFKQPLLTSDHQNCHLKWQVASSTPADVGSDKMLVLHSSENKKKNLETESDRGLVLNRIKKLKREAKELPEFCGLKDFMDTNVCN